MVRIVLDFETYYSHDYSLRRMPTVLYVRSPEFLALGVGIKIDDQEPQWHSTDLDEVLHTLPWNDAALIGQNLYFDGMILAEHYGIYPREYRDTRSMANMLLPTGFKRGLDDVAKLLGHQGKLEGVLTQLKGVRDPDPELIELLGEYCKQDVEATAYVYEALWPHVPEEERILMHMTTRMGVASRIQLDVPLLRTEIEEQSAKRDALILSGNTPASVLRSNDQFIALLATLTDDPVPMKEGKNGPIPALGKADAGWNRFKADHPELSDLLTAREAAKSNILVKRPQRFLEIALAPPHTLPMAYNFSAAGTHRWGSADGLGVMNIPSTRISKLRHCLKAPKGQVIHVCDLSQIELRMQLWLSGQRDKLDKLAGGEDLYKAVASEVFSKPLDQITKEERGIAKAISLGCQFGIGARRYRAYMAGGPLGLPPINLTEAEAQHHINAYRATHPNTVSMWRRLDDHIPIMATEHDPIQIGPISIEHERIRLPNNTFLDYSGLRCEEGQWIYGVGKHWAFLHGPKLLENCVQALARIPIGTAAIAIERELGLEVAGWVHDEVLVIAPEDRAEENQAKITEIMTRPLSWAPDLPLAAEGGWDKCYSK